MSVLLRRREANVEILTLNRPVQRNMLGPELTADLEAIHASRPGRNTV
jgi:enoyl-CoA hydratase/carnithine racemase